MVRFVTCSGEQELNRNTGEKVVAYDYVGNGGVTVLSAGSMIGSADKEPGSPQGCQMVNTHGYLLRLFRPVIWLQDIFAV